MRSTLQSTDGRSRSHRTPVADSIAGQYYAGTLLRFFHMLQTLAATPIRLASTPTPPTFSTASSSAVMLESTASMVPLNYHVRDYVTTTNVMQASGQITYVAEPKTGVALRIETVRLALGLSLAALGAAAGGLVQSANSNYVTGIP